MYANHQEDDDGGDGRSGGDAVGRARGTARNLRAAWLIHARHIADRIERKTPSRPLG